jgi:NitT/TauT family transport system ATP-binding protein
MVPRIELLDAGKVYQTRQGGVEALAGISLSVDEGEFLSVVGPSGCGKSTLIRILAGLQEATSGEVRVQGAAGSGGPASAVVFQEHTLFPWRTALQNVAFGLEMRGVSRRERLRSAREHLARVGLASFEKHYPHQLSGGMKQRVGLARALATGPEILLMDEPFGSLDAQTRTILQGELLRIWEEERKTVVYVTHSIEEAILLGDRVVLMSARPGRIRRSYPVDLPRPRDLDVRTTAPFAAMTGEIWAELVEEVGGALR